MELILLDPELKEQAAQFSQRFGLLLVGAEHLRQSGFHLCLDQQGISLQQGSALADASESSWKKPKKHKPVSPVRVDFSQGAVAHRRKFGGGQGQDIAKAIGVSAYKPSVVDATAGLGRDSFVLATLGCEVLAFERHPQVAALLADGLARAASDDEIADIIARIELCFGSSHELLRVPQGQDFLADVVYLDPMFEHDDKATAQVKKDMQAFRHIVGQDLDADDLLTAALTCARCRVVVKRARKARPLNDVPPDYAITGKANRFDVYVKAKVAALV